MLFSTDSGEDGGRNCCGPVNRAIDGGSFVLNCAKESGGNFRKFLWANVGSFVIIMKFGCELPTIYQTAVKISSDE